MVVVDDKVSIIIIDRFCLIYLNHRRHILLELLLNFMLLSYRLIHYLLRLISFLLGLVILLRVGLKLIGLITGVR